MAEVRGSAGRLEHAARVKPPGGGGTHLAHGEAGRR